MSYKHKWVNDKFDWFAVDKNGNGYEFNSHPTERFRVFTGTNGTYGNKLVSHSYTGNWKESLQQRYTDQQMELETQGWTPWSAGDDTPKHDSFLDIACFNKFSDATDKITLASNNRASDIVWHDESTVIAYRLSNANGYKDGVKVDCDCGKYMASTGGNHLPKCGLSKESYIDPDKPEWKDGELPPFGTKCEAIWSELPDGGNPEWLPVTFKGGFDSKLWFSNWDGEIVIPAHEVKFRPIQTNKERVINEAMLVVEILENNTGDEVLSIMRELYDAGMLSMPDNGEE